MSNLSTLLATAGSGQVPLQPIELPGGFTDPNPNNAPTLITNLANTVIGFLTVVAGLAFVLYFVLGAINWITAGGDEAKVEKAKNQMVNAAIGLIIVVAAYTIIGVVSLVTGLDIINFTSILGS